MSTTGDGSRSFSAALAQEETRLSAEYPKHEDIPTCMSHLDEFFRSLGPQFKAMYRHGTLAVCQPKFEEFKFCLSIKMLEPEERRKAWIRRRAEWWASRRVGKSRYSEPLQNFPPPPILSPDPVPENTAAAETGCSGTLHAKHVEPAQLGPQNGKLMGFE
ncbi:hypothetical protein AG1IA_07165 [Rhizoctonia solani AG-1 IA]|uniref:Uncharacterized protein n=1 Tax=Thanatephorus cucumeris (strain AG1-IA) TaxID=983506 RepID=L8WLL1_THACA|nr:hypothetical protein AG1IA_07165 [Rhizoctonia solani AG-1 IA]